MRRALALALTACVLAGLSGDPSWAQTPEVSQASGYSALALWTQPIEGSRRYDVFWAFAATGVENDEQVTVGGAGRFTCNTDRWDIVQIFCFRGRIRDLDTDQFTFDPLLREATLTIDVKGVTNEVVWTASEDPVVFHGFDSCCGYSGAGADIVRRATAEGSILGTALPLEGSRILGRLAFQSGVLVYDGTSARSGV